MSDDAFKFLAAAIVAICQVYQNDDGHYTALARLWDFVARVMNVIAVAAARMAMNARHNYFMVVNSYGY